MSQAIGFGIYGTLVDPGDERASTPDLAGEKADRIVASSSAATSLGESAVSK